MLAKPALLIIDMQEYFLNKNSHAFISDSRRIIPQIKKIKKKFLNNNFPVLHTQHLNTRQDAGQMSAWWQNLITEDNPLSSLSQELIDDDSQIIKKTQYDAFYNTDLKKILKQKKIKQLIITGVATHLCCETTARSAFVHNFSVKIISDATASFNPEFHASSLKNLAHGFAEVNTTNELIEDFNAS